jgi:hypothetical protein
MAQARRRCPVTPAPAFSPRSKCQRGHSLIGGGRRYRRRCGGRHVTRPGGRRRSRRRRRGTSRGRGRIARLIGPAVSNDQSENRDSGDERRQPCPQRSRAVGPLEIETTQRIVTARIGVAGVRHDSPPFLRGPTALVRKLPTVHNVPAHERRARRFDTSKFATLLSSALSMSGGTPVGSV